MKKKKASNGHWFHTAARHAINRRQYIIRLTSLAAMSFAAKVARHFGQVCDTLNHPKIHSLWKVCPQYSLYVVMSSPKSSKQTTQVSMLAAEFQLSKKKCSPHKGAFISPTGHSTAKVMMQKRVFLS